MVRNEGIFVCVCILLPGTSITKKICLIIITQNTCSGVGNRGGDTFSCKIAVSVSGELSVASACNQESQNEGAPKILKGGVICQCMNLRSTPETSLQSRLADPATYRTEFLPGGLHRKDPAANESFCHMPINDEDLSSKKKTTTPTSLD